MRIRHDDLDVLSARVFQEDGPDLPEEAKKLGWQAAGEVRMEQMLESGLDLPAAVFPGAPVRAQDLRYIVSCLRQGQCCSLVAPSNMGKSYLLKSLASEEARRLCAPGASNAPVAVFVDCLEAGDSEHALYELMLRRIVEELEDSGVQASTIDTLRALHHEVLGAVTELSVRSLFARSVRELNRGGEIHLVVILDEFDDVFRSLPPWPFRQLRALRDALDDRLCYVTGTSRRLERLRSDADTYEFRELFHLYTLVMHPLSEKDARRLLVYLESKHGTLIEDDWIALLLDLSGGHPGLLERLFSTLNDVGREPSGQLQVMAGDLCRLEPIKQECQRLWGELLEEEQEGLLALTGRGEASVDPAHRRALQAKGLAVVRHGGNLALFSPVFEAFVHGELARRRRARPDGLHCDLKTGQIWADDREVTLALSEAQRKLARLLCQKDGAVCSYDEIAREVWGAGEGVSPGAIYELVKRVRQKVELDWRTPRYIVTVPGAGYRLQGPD